AERPGEGTGSGLRLVREQPNRPAAVPPQRANGLGRPRPGGGPERDPAEDPAIGHDFQGSPLPRARVEVGSVPDGEATRLVVQSDPAAAVTRIDPEQGQPAGSTGRTQSCGAVIGQVSKGSGAEAQEGLR